MKKKAIIAIVVSLMLGGFLAQAISVNAQPYFFSVNIIVSSGNIARVTIAEIVAAELGKIGIEAIVEPIEHNVMLETLEGKRTTYAEGGWDIICFSTETEFDPDQINVLHSNSIPPAGSNYMNYMNGIVDNLLEAGLKELDPAKRKPIYDQIWEITHDEIPYIGMIQTAQIQLVRKEVEGLDDCVDWYGSQYGTDGIKFLYLPGEDTIRHGSYWMSGYVLQTLGHCGTFSGVFDNLIVNDPEGKYVGVLAESWDFSPDSKSITFHLKEGVTWHDGEPFTSADVAFTIDSWLNPDVGAKFHGFMLDTIESYETPDDYTITINFKAPNAAFIPRQMDVANQIMPKHILEDVPVADWVQSDYNTGKIPLVGTGPWKLVEVVSEEYCLFERNEDYHIADWIPGSKYLIWEKIPDRAVAWSALLANDIQSVTVYYHFETELDDVDAQADLKYGVSPSYGADGWYINLNHPILGNKLVRQAIAHCVPHDRLVDDVFSGLGWSSNILVDATSTWYPTGIGDPYPYDIEAAKALMEEAGFKYAYLEAPAAAEMDYMPYVIGAVIGLIVGAVVVYGITKMQK